MSREICGECKYNKRDFSKPQNSSYAEFCCGNEDSDNYGVPTMYDDSCDDFEEKSRLMDNENHFISLARHAIGLDHKEPYKRHGKLFYRPYRNYYDASPKDCETWELMCDAGYADRGRKDRYGGRMYWLSRKGLDWLGEKLGIKIYDEDD